MMKLIKEYRLELKTRPDLPNDSTVTYVESQFNPGINQFIENNLVEIKAVFAAEGLSFKFMPEEKQHSCEVLDENLPSDIDVEPSVICSGSNYQGASGLYRYEAYHLDLKWIKNDSMMMLQFQDIAKAYSRHGALDYTKVSEDEEITRMLSEMEILARALKVKGVRTDVFDSMINSLEQPSRLVIDHLMRPVLPDFGNMVIKLNPMEKALYAFFLKHPEGIQADELVGHQNELMELYSRTSLFDDKDVIKNAVYALCDESKSTLYTNISRIKAKFTKMLGESQAQHYIIRKDSNGIYKIALPRELLAWMA